MFESIITIFILSFASILGVLFINKDSKKDLVLKILSIVYFCITFIFILLPDGLIMSVDDDSMLLNVNKFYLVVRTFTSIIPIVLLISCFYNNKYFNMITVFLVLPICLISIFCYKEHMFYALMESGRGLRNVSGVSAEFKNFLISSGFRSCCFVVEKSFPLIISVLIVLKTDFSSFKVKDFLISLVICLLLVIQFMPIYIPQLLFGGFSDVLFKQFGIIHFLWMIYTVIKILVIYKLFNKSDNSTKCMVCIILAIADLIQYNSMFSLTINIKRLPLQLCNIASYMMLIAILTKNKKLFNFNFLVNVLGALLALVLPDVNNRGIFEVWNMHFIYEHTNIIVVPVICYLFGLFGSINKKSYRDAVIGFSIYFIVVLALGVIFNNIAININNKDFEANYLFMFDTEKAYNLLPFLKFTSTLSIRLGNFSIYPLLMLVVFFGYNFFVFLFYLPFYFIERNKEHKKLKI